MGGAGCRSGGFVSVRGKTRPLPATVIRTGVPGGGEFPLTRQVTTIGADDGEAGTSAVITQSWPK